MHIIQIKYKENLNTRKLLDDILVIVYTFSMSKKLIIALHGIANSGKTSALTALRDSLQQKLPNYVEDLSREPDFIGHFPTERVNIGISTAGDYADCIQEGIQELHAASCDLIFIATRTKGATTETLERLASQYGYEWVWMGKEWIRDFTPLCNRNPISSNKLTDMFCNHFTESAEEIIRLLYPGLI